MHTLLFSLLQLIYPLPPPSRTRTRPLEVLALGISRSSTESLRQALLELGYLDVYHGFSYGTSPNDPVRWIRLAQAQDAGEEAFLTAKEFDKIIGGCAAITDIPCAGFAHELLECFPDAKVILNYREDLEAWEESCLNTIEVVTHDWGEEFLSYFQPNLFWRRKSYWYVWTRLFGGDFKRNGKGWYRRHYASLEEKLKGEGRSYLKWRVEDGWGPLCEFLGKEGRKKEFPKGNVPREFIERSQRNKAVWNEEAKRNLMKLTIGLGLAIVAYVGMAYFR